MSVADEMGPTALVADDDPYGPRPTWRGWLHFGAFLVVLPAGLYLLTVADSVGARVAVAIYWASLAGLFATSASYHRLARTPRSVLWFRRADHSMIYVLIAGTYTPLCLIALPRIWGIPMLVVAWVTALAGVILKMVRLGVGDKSSGSWLYIVMGWVALVATPVLVESLTGLQLALIVAGGVAYTVGFPVLLVHRPNPWPSTFGYHEVWHLLTVVAAGLHFAAVADVLA